MSDIRHHRGREVWSEVEPFALLGRAGAVPSTDRTPVPFAAAVAALRVPSTVQTARPRLELLAGQGEHADARSAADLVLLPGWEDQVATTAEPRPAR